MGCKHWLFCLKQHPDILSWSKTVQTDLLCAKLLASQKCREWFKSYLIPLRRSSEGSVTRASGVKLSQMLYGARYPGEQWTSLAEMKRKFIKSSLPFSAKSCISCTVVFLHSADCCRARWAMVPGGSGDSQKQLVAVNHGVFPPPCEERVRLCSFSACLWIFQPARGKIKLVVLTVTCRQLSPCLWNKRPVWPRAHILSPRFYFSFMVFLPFVTNPFPRTNVCCSMLLFKLKLLLPGG